MDWHAGIRAALTTSRRPPDDDVVDELAEHARALYETSKAAGLDHAEAVRRVEAQIATWRSQAEALRERAGRPPAVEPPPATPASWWAGLGQDARYARRLLWRQRRFAAIAILTMALGIGPATALFGVVRAVLLRPLPWTDADRLVTLKETRGGSPPRFGSISSTTYHAWRDQAATIDSLGGWAARTVIMGGTGEPERLRATAVTASMFQVLDIRPILGHLFGEGDESERVIVLTESLWRERWAADPHVVGRMVRLDGEPYSIRGVTADAVAYPDRSSRAWVPFRVTPPGGNQLSMFEALARLRPGASIEQAAAEGTARGRFTAATPQTTIAIFGNDGPVGIGVSALGEAMTRDVRTPLIVLFTAVALLLVIAVSNVANLQLARATTRRRELAIRAAIGAGRARLVRQLFVERSLLGLLGGAAGLAVAWGLHQAAMAILPVDFPRVQELTIDGPILLLPLVLAFGSSLLFGWLPVLGLRRLHVTGALGAGASPARSSGPRLFVTRARLLTLGGQVAMASALLVAAALFGRSFISLLQVDRGFSPAQILSAPIQMTGPGYTPQRRIAVLEETIAALQSSPGVRHVAFTSEAPLTPGGSTSSMTLPGRAGGPPAMVQASPRQVSPAYFAVLGLRVIAGRSLEDTDTATSQPVVVVNETFARRFLGPAPLGVKVPMGIWGQSTPGQAEIVGVVADIRYVGAAVTSLPEMYFSYRQVPVGLRSSIATLLLTSDGHPTALAPDVRRAVRDADTGAVVTSILTLEDRLLAGSLARPRLYAMLLGIFALVALTVTAVGLFAVLSHSVEQRTPELALRAALGARPRDLVSLVVRQGTVVVVIGLAAGLGLSWWSMKFASTALYGVTATDPQTYFAVPAVVALVAAIATIVPARRAARLDPQSALKRG